MRRKEQLDDVVSLAEQVGIPEVQVCDLSDRLPYFVTPRNKLRKRSYSVGASREPLWSKL
jgi:hypothetical protein